MELHCPDLHTIEMFLCPFLFKWSEVQAHWPQRLRESDRWLQKLILVCFNAHLFWVLGGSSCTWKYVLSIKEGRPRHPVLWICSDGPNRVCPVPSGPSGHAGMQPTHREGGSAHSGHRGHTALTTPNQCDCTSSLANNLRRHLITHSGETSCPQGGS